MINIIRVPDKFKIHYDTTDFIRDDGVLRFEGIDGKLKVLLTATRSKPALLNCAGSAERMKKSAFSAMPGSAATAI